MRLTIQHKGLPGSARWAPVGPGLIAPATFTARFEHPPADDGSAPGDHTVTLHCSIENRRAVCDRIDVERRDGLPPLTGDELRRLPIANWTANAVEEIAMVLQKVESPAGRETVVGRPAERGWAARQRNAVTPDRLAEVAAVYSQSSGAHADRVTAVREGLHLSRSQAYRLVNRAADTGLVERID